MAKVRGFGDLEAANAMRSLIERIALAVIADKIPAIRIGRVYSFDSSAGKVKILFGRDTVDNLVSVSVARNMWPQTVMETAFASQGYNAPADVVRVWGTPGAWFVIDYVKGGPISKFS